MGKVLELYRTQIDVLWNWSGGPVALVKRFLITLVVGHDRVPDLPRGCCRASPWTPSGRPSGP